MNDSDVGYSYEWESDFINWVKTNNKENSNEKLDVSEDYPDIKKNYSENFVLQNLFDENN